MPEIGEKRYVRRLPVVREEKYGAAVWTNQRMDAVRRVHCLCLNCGNFKPQTEENCEIAQKNFEIAKAHGVAMMITRCPDWEQK